MRRSLSSTLVLALMVATGCVRNPVTGKKQLTLVSEKQEIALGAQTAQQVEQQMGLLNAPQLQAYVERVGMKLAKASERPHLPWSFKVVDDPVPNAFALPGGFIFVTRGMLTHLNSEAELAMVLGHEVGHVTAKHSVSQITKSQLAQVGLGLGMVLVPELQGVGNLAGAGLQLLFLKFGRDAERQSDDLGFKYSLAHGYDAREGADVFRTLGRVSQASGQGRIPEWLATHPNPENRVERLVAKAAQTHAPWDRLKSGEQEYLAQVDGMVYGENPRNGYFQGNAFLHPDLKFQLTFPQGWKAQNTAQAVVAVSPNQDAVVLLAPAGQLAPEQALRSFLSSPGVATGGAGMSNIHGAPAASAVFQARSQQGVVQGLVTFLSHEGKTFQVVSYTSAQRFGAMAPTFERAVQSFAPLTDPQALAVQPSRLDVMKLPRDMSLNEVAQESGQPAETLALINGVSAGQKLEAGTPVKTVVKGGSGGQSSSR